MGRGLALPVKPGPDGRAMMLEDDDQLDSVIMIGLNDCTSANPFQSLGIPMDNIFDLNDDSVRGRVRDYLERFFKRLQNAGRARLLSVTAESELSEQGEAVLVVRYMHMKTRTPRDVTFGIGRTGTARILED